jgi:hypothetical protein
MNPAHRSKGPPRDAAPSGKPSLWSRCQSALSPGFRDYVLVSWVFTRVLALIYFAAFASLSVQIVGLAGARGILPVAAFLDRAYDALGHDAYWRVPTLFWLGRSDAALTAACWAGTLAALLVFANLFTRAGLLLCYALYLSLSYAGQEFLSFQWDLFLLESGFLALLLTGRSPIAAWLYRFLLFRFMLMGGVVKLASGDPAWRGLTALRYHFETQPLPTPLAWYAHWLPDGLLRLATGAVFFIELIVPFLVFLPRPFRLFAAASFVVLQGAIILTGNYTFFNLLTLALCLFLLEDRDLQPWFSARLADRILRQARPPGPLAHAGAGLMALVAASTLAGLLWLTPLNQRPFPALYGLVRAVSTFGLVNGYGPFAVMTTERREIVVEGSDDGQNWLAYEFKYKPGDPGRALGWSIPHQPRLDWQMWFAALGDARQSPWFVRFMARLREGSPAVLALLRRDPFHGRPPRYLRASLYLYAFSSAEQRADEGWIWERRRLGDYLSMR